ncbi:MAG: fold metallo-hydrolase [Verrucomicrobiales bacterium]|nr:fold metallo-hydrolase [Verrucomicrobiales bacterium]
MPVPDRGRSRLIPSLHMFSVISIKVSNGEFVNYCYAIVDSASNEALLIDPAWEMDRIEHSLSGAALKGVLLTHSHRDHADLACHFASRYRVPIWISREESEYYCFELPGLLHLPDAGLLRIGPFEVWSFLTPGHTAGGVCYLVENNLFSGDTLFAEGCGYCSERGADPYAMYRSLQLLKRTILPNTLVFPGHSYGQLPGQTFASLLKTNIYLAFDDERKFVQFRMRGEWGFNQPV